MAEQELEIKHLSRNDLVLLQSVYARFAYQNAKLLLDKYYGIRRLRIGDLTAEVELCLV
jgi:hypothetical protein